MTRPTPATFRVCLVCAGNICRSPMAEVVLRAKLAAAGLGDVVEVDSAGVGDWHISGSASGGALGAMQRRGYESRHRARNFEPAWFADRDLVLALDADNARALRRLAPDSDARAKVRMLGSYAVPPIPGPEASDDGEFDRAAALDAAQSVPDPYGGTDADFDHALDLIEAACSGFVETLRTTGRL